MRAPSEPPTPVGAENAGYARRLTKDEPWIDLAVYFGPEHEGGNSHMPMLGTYLDMLAVFLPL